MILAPFWLPLWHPVGRSGLLFNTFLCRVALNVGTILVDLGLMLAFGWSFLSLVLYAVVSFLYADSYPRKFIICLLFRSPLQMQTKSNALEGASFQDKGAVG